MHNNKVSLALADANLNSSGVVFKTFFTHGSLQLELYMPGLVDRQTPHIRDEVYIIASGTHSKTHPRRHSEKPDGG